MFASRLVAAGLVAVIIAAIVLSARLKTVPDPTSEAEQDYARPSR
jgi:hypothetical protein